MANDWKYYRLEPKGRTAWAAEKEYFSFRREVMSHGISPSQQKALEEKKQAVQSAKAALADLVGLNPCMDQFLNRHPKYVPR
jgi:hypothetical protein